MKNIIYIALGGSIGAVARYLISKYFDNAFPLSNIPIGTLTVNVIGSFLIGTLFALFHHYSAPTEIKLFMAIGILGAFTTFSSFSFETIELFKQNGISYGLLNVALNNIACLLMILAGSYTVNLFLKIKSI
ncbi:MAG: fluoride efflux transporter CrcB [Candidatus Delongbacteria bacterium]|nr:fluoride efflux transporter CrcB [Candidatus Delongbacteria bacterium]